MGERPFISGRTVAGIGISLVIVIGSGMAGCPQYSVYSSRLTGEAELAWADQNRQIKVREAQALRDSAQLKSEAEVIRAESIAKANKIVADSLGGPEGYLRYLYIENLQEMSKGNTVIYVPTEAGLPILEATRNGRK